MVQVAAKPSSILLMGTIRHVYSHKMQCIFTYQR